MKRKNPSSAVDDENSLKRARPTLVNNGKSRVTAWGFTSFPEAVACIVGDYLSNSSRKYVEIALVGVQPTTLCLSQNVDSPLDTCWSIGFLPSEHHWESWNAKIDKQFPITDVEGCLYFLDQTNSGDCHIVVEVLVVKLSMTSSDSPSVLDDLRNTIGMLQGHLSNIKHVVFSITEHSFCCFTLKNAIDKETGFSLPVDHQQVLLEIIDDLEACWDANRRLTPVDLFAFYFTSDVERASEIHLAKFVVSLNHPLSQVLFRQEASRIVSNKIMWVFSLKSEADFHVVDQYTTRFCHAFFMDMSIEENPRMHLDAHLRNFSFYRDNRFIERIMIKSGEIDHAVQLPRPSASFTDITPLSPLIELTLTGGNNNFHITELNTGYFPHLAHLTLININISGHLDSHRVPSLKTLRLELEGFTSLGNLKNHSLVHERAQSLIHSGRPWQLVATEEPGGWSLASYDKLIANSQEEVKDDSFHPHSLPLIRELLLVMERQSEASQWQSQLRGDLSLEAATGDHSDRLLVWAPQCVQKITAICTSEYPVQLEFKELIPEQTRILTSFTSYDMNVVLNGAVLPNLHSLELNGGNVKLSGAFSHLESLVFNGGRLQAPCQLEAPLLQSFSCHDLRSSTRLTLNLQLLPHLSFLKIIRRFMDGYSYPKMINIDTNLGLARVKHVVFNEAMTEAPFFDKCLVNGVSHLELTVDASELPDTWDNTEWQCEILSIDIFIYTSEPLDELDSQLVLVLPQLPRVKILTVTEKHCQVLLDREMPELTDCTVPSPLSLGPNLKCPALRCVHFTEKLSKSDKEMCLNPVLYSAFGAQPKLVYFDYDGEVKKMSWDIAAGAAGVSYLVGAFEDDGDSCVSHE